LCDAIGFGYKLDPKGVNYLPLSELNRNRMENWYR